jgi:hypothetical protein
MRHVTNQIGAFAHASGRALRAMAERLDALEQQVGGAGPVADARLREAVADSATSARVEEIWRDLVARAFADAPVPVLRIEGDDGYERLANVADASVGAVLVAPGVDDRARGWKIRLAEKIGEKTVPGAVVVVVSCEPDAWADAGSPVVADLAPGRPFHAATWIWLLARQGFVDPAVERAAGPPASYAVVVRRPARV